MKTILDITGVPEETKCEYCGITALESVKLPAVETGINHPEYCKTKSFYCYGGYGKLIYHLCPRCHKEKELGDLFDLMDRKDSNLGRAYEKL